MLPTTDIIVRAAQNNLMVIITYKNSKGNITQRETEPYEIKDGAYWGYCLSQKGIRRFNLNNILGAVATNKNYVPRWEVKIK